MIGRIVAVLIMAGSAGVLAYHHRAALLPVPETPADPAEIAFRACLDDRSAGIEAMRSDGTITQEQAALFLTRAEALCRNTTTPQQ